MVLVSKGVSDDDIFTSRKDVPEIYYTGEDGAEYRYYADIYVESENAIYEVKAYAKLNSAKENYGLNCHLMVFDKHGSLIKQVDF
jgi:uncharacterized protein YabN with tetrapyrrole methylase and pyrophosphatase domain